MSVESLLCPRCGVATAPFPIEVGVAPFFCRACLGAWFRSSDASVHLGREVSPDPLSISLPSAYSCPDCTTPLTRKPFRSGEPLVVDVCETCHGLWLDDKELPALRRTLARTRAARVSCPAVSPPFEPEPAALRFRSLGVAGELAALPFAFALAWFISLLPVVSFPFGYARLLLHELGHAFAGWTLGHAAIPLPIGFTVWSHDSSRFVQGLVALLCLSLVVAGVRSRKRFLVVAGVAWGGLALFAMRFVGPQSAERWMVFGGAAGEIVLSALLVCAFPWRLPGKVRWDFWRFVALVVGAYVFLRAWQTWSAAVNDSSRIPWGSLLGDASDGDMERLRDTFGWPAARIASTYFAWAKAAFAAMGMSFGLGALFAERD